MSYFLTVIPTFITFRYLSAVQYVRWNRFLKLSNNLTNKKSRGIQTKVKLWIGHIICGQEDKFWN